MPRARYSEWTRSTLLTRDFPLGIVVIRRRQQSAEDHLGHVHLLDLVFDDRNALAIVPDADLIRLPALCNDFYS